jgi:pimeloyl-ACP methyl ester carboxylesterase
VNGGAWRKALLVCGIASSLLYALMIWGIRYEGYSLISQVPSELTAIGAPTEPLWALLGAFYTLLIIAFGLGVWHSAGPQRRVRIVGALILTYGSLGLLWPFAPMHQRAVLAAGGGTLGDSLHVALAGVLVLVMFLTIWVASTAFGRRFRVYSTLSIVILLTFGALTFIESPRLQADLPTPWIGLWERINISVFLLWILVLATLLLRGQRSSEEQGRARFLSVYNDTLKRWPVPYEELDVPTRFGTTHVIAAGPRDAPPLVLLHGFMGTALMWGSNVADFAAHYRVYAIDIMGQPSKSVPEAPIRQPADYVDWLTATLDALNLGRVSLTGMSFGGCVALRYALAVPDRIEQLVLLSAGGILPMAKQFTLRGMLMMAIPTRLTVNSFMRWAGCTQPETRPVLDLMYLGAKHLPIAKETMGANQVVGSALSDTELRSLRMPVLLLFGDGEVICDPVKALARARRLVPYLEGDVIPGCRHEMCFSRSRIVDARVLDFLERTRKGVRSTGVERSAA